MWRGALVSGFGCIAVLRCGLAFCAFPWVGFSGLRLDGFVGICVFLGLWVWGVLISGPW